MLESHPMRPDLRFFLPILLLLSFLLVAQTESGVEITSEPSHHKSFENEYVRVFRVWVQPHASTLLHRHRHDYVFVTLGDADISNEVEGKSPVEAKLADGETRFVSGNFAHVARNLSDQPFRNVTIELLQDEQMRSAVPHWTEESGEENFPGGHGKILFVKDGVRVSSVDLEPGTQLPKEDFKGPTLLVAINQMQLSNGRTHREELTPGAQLWSDGPLAKTNVGKQPARFITLEF
jgi:hypothetical protein